MHIVDRAAIAMAQAKYTTVPSARNQAGCTSSQFTQFSSTEGSSSLTIFFVKTILLYAAFRPVRSHLLLAL
jgi:hypothetical protein